MPKKTIVGDDLSRKTVGGMQVLRGCDRLALYFWHCFPHNLPTSGLHQQNGPYWPHTGPKTTKSCLAVYSPRHLSLIRTRPLQLWREKILPPSLSRIFWEWEQFTGFGLLGAGWLSYAAQASVVAADCLLDVHITTVINTACHGAMTLLGQRASFIVLYFAEWIRL